mgnify:CR=1 FL=1
MLLFSFLLFTYNFDEIIDRSNTNSLKYGLVPFRNPDLPDDFISMWVAYQDFEVASPIIDAMKHYLDKYSIITDPEYFLKKGWCHYSHTSL